MASLLLIRAMNQLAAGTLIGRKTGILLRTCKYAILLLLLVNARAMPILWHIRVFVPVFRLRLEYRLLCLRHVFASKRVKDMAKERWFKSIMPRDQNPFQVEVRHSAWAGPEDSDYNMHLSNSAYPKILDQARLKAALRLSPTFFRAGGWMALGATHHQFIREIPMFAKFEVRLSVGSWDQKWIYVVCRFVSFPKPKSKKSRPTPAPRDALLPSLHTPATPLDAESLSGTTTPNLAARALALEPDGATLHCIAVSALCYKIGRITVPPAVVLAHEGLRDAAYTATASPPALQNVRDVRPLRKLFQGAWRDVPAEERWWEQALGGDVERMRAERMPMFEGLRSGMEGAREARII